MTYFSLSTIEASSDEESEEESGADSEEEDPEDDEEEAERERLKRISVQNDIAIIMDIKKYASITRERISQTIFAPAAEPPKISKPLKKKSKSPSKRSTERAYSVDGEIDLVEQAMKILQTTEQSKVPSSEVTHSDRNCREPDRRSSYYDSHDDDSGSGDSEGDDDVQSEDSIGAPQRKAKPSKSKMKRKTGSFQE